MGSKRKSEDAKVVEECTPGGKKSRATGNSSLKKAKKIDPPIQAIEGGEEDCLITMPDRAPDAARSPKPPTAEEFKSMLREGLANVAKKDQIDVMMAQIKGNSEALILLDKKVDSTNEATERRLKCIEERLDREPPASTSFDASKTAAFEKSRRSL